MPFNIGDLVTRNSYNNDTIFKIMDIDSGIATLKGVNIRLEADSNIDDLKKVEIDKNINDDQIFLDRFEVNLNRDEYFYLPGKVLHIDSDEDYLSRCMKFYDKVHVHLFGIEMLHQFPCSLGGATGGEQVVVNEHHIVFVDRIDVHFYGIYAIFFRV